MASSASDFPSLVSAAWLQQNLGAVRLLDASWYMPGAKEKDAALADFRAERIPGSRFFDLDRIADLSVDLPHMLPSEAQFAAAADALGISNGDAVVVYDRAGIFSAPRAWWTWHVFGHNKVAVLDGGLPAWKAAGGAMDTAPVDEAALAAAGAAAQAPPPSGELRYRAKLRAEEVRDWKQMLANVDTQQEGVVDARPAARWKGAAPEPRAGLRSGHIPGSCCVPWNSVLVDGRFKSVEELKEVFSAAGVELGSGRPLVASCGSGTTACILALAARQVVPDAPPVAIYDGSWSEWGGLPDVPVATSE